jgi:2-dehydropantoate 2-reductase
MRVCIVGCGAVGSLFAANLGTLADVEVWAYDLMRDHVDAINRDGLRLTGAGDVVGKVRATADASELPPCDFGIVATKAMHTDAAISTTAHAFADGSVATVQNGIGNEEVLARHVRRVIRGTTFPAGKLIAPGVVQWDIKGDTTLGPFEPQPAPLEEVERLAMPARALGCRRRRSRRAGRSGAGDLNAATNCLAPTGPHHGPFASSRRCARLTARRRGKAVATAGDRARLRPEDLIDYAARPEVGYDHKASMLQDVEARRQTRSTP